MNYKRTMCLILVICLALSMVTPVGAVNTDQTSTAINPDIRTKMLRVLSSVEQEKEYYGLTNVDFSAVAIGTEIPSYRVSSGDLVETGLHIYPVLLNDEIVSLFFAAKDINNEWYVQLSSELVGAIHNAAPVGNLSIIYDDVGAYLYTSSSFSLLGYTEEAETILATSTLQQNSVEAISTDSLASLELGTVACQDTLNVQAYTDALPASTAVLPNGVSLPVQIIQQPANTDICWAITLTSIANYIFDGSWTYTQIVNMFTDGEDTKLQPAVAISKFNTYFSADYIYVGSSSAYALDPDFVVERLYAGYPLYGSFLYNGKGHAVVIKGANWVSYTFSVMNPTPTTTGYTAGTISSSKIWTFVSAYSGNTYTLRGVGYYSIG